MNIKSLETKFKKIGADVKINMGVSPRNGEGYTVNVEKGTFIVSVTGRDEASLPDINVVDIDPKDRHLLLNITTFSKNKGGAILKDKGKWLCGHDERDWFVGAIPNDNVLWTASKCIFA